MPSFKADEKAEALRKLQTEIYFEKTISASSASFHRRYSALTLPASFVQEHGDKFGRWVTLRSGSAPKPWHHVKLTIAGEGKVQVKLSAGWKAFAAANELLVGDSLIFHLTGVSEFTVHVFHANKMGSFKGFEPSRKNEQHDDARVGGGDKIGLLRELQGSVHFERTLSSSSSSQCRGSRLTLPSWFVREHGGKIRKSVVLRTESSAKRWDVNLTINCRSPTATLVKFAGGWRAFADFHRLLEGDELVFSLTAMSEFQVYLFSGSGSLRRRPASQAPRKRFNDESQKTEDQLHACTDERLSTSNEGTVLKKAVGEEYAVSSSDLKSNSCARRLLHFVDNQLEENNNQQHLPALTWLYLTST